MTSVLHVPHYDVEKQAMIEPFSYLEMETSASNPRSDLSLWVRELDGTLMLGNATVSSSDGVLSNSLSTDNALARFDGTTGKILQNSGIILGDDNILVIPGSTATIKLSATQIVNINAINCRYGINAGTAMTNNTAGFCNTAIGNEAGILLTTGIFNTLTGYQAAGNHITTSYNTVIGNRALFTQSSSADSRNVIIGHQTAFAGAESSVVIGVDAGKSATQRLSVIIGTEVNKTNTIASTQNVLIGESVMRLATGVSTFGIVALGYACVSKVASCNQSVMIGESILNQYIGDAGANCIVGYRSLFNASSGTLRRNTLLGNEVCYSVTSNPNDNTVIGYNALRSSVNVGDKNVVIGAFAGSAHTTGTTITKNIWIANPGVNGESNTIRVGNTTDHTTCFISGVYAASDVDTTYKIAKIGTNGQIVGGMLYSDLATQSVTTISFTFQPNTTATPVFVVIGVTLVKQGRSIVMHVPSVTLALASPVSYYETDIGTFTAGYIPAVGKTFVTPIFTRTMGGVDVDIMGRATLGLFSTNNRLRIEKEPAPGMGTFNGATTGWDAFTMTYFTD